MIVPARWIEMLPWYPGYWISDDGRAIGRRGHELSIHIINGYHTVRIQDVRQGYAIQRHIRINRVVCWHFNGAYPNDGMRYVAAHLDGDPGNNNYWNLEWQTYGENNNNPLRNARSSATWARHRAAFNNNKMCELRIEAGLTQGQLGAIIGVSGYTVYRWEDGISAPNKANRDKLARALDVPVSTLLR